MHIVKKSLSWIILISFMVIIFMFSHQSAIESTDTSMGFIERILEIFTNLSAEKITEFADFIETPIRKLAHFTLYFILGLLSFNALYHSDIKDRKILFISALAISILYAVTDEIHQLFIPGRAGMIRDVLLDSFGSLCGVSLLEFICKKLNKI